MEIATAASANASAILRAVRNSGFVRCHAALIRNASSMPMPLGQKDVQQIISIHWHPQRQMNGLTFTMALYKQPSQSSNPKALTVAINGHSNAAKPSRGLLRTQSMPITRPDGLLTRKYCEEASFIHRPEQNNAASEAEEEKNEHTARKLGHQRIRNILEFMASNLSFPQSESTWRPSGKLSLW